MSKIDFGKRFEEFVISRGYFLKSPYVKNNIKVNLTCNNGHDFLIRPKSFKSGQGCPKCAGNCPEQAKAEFEQLVTDRGHLLKSPYVGAMSKISITCNNGHDFLVSPNSFKSGQGCPKCARLCPEQVKEEFEQLVTARGHLLKSPYISALKKVNLTCNNGHHFLMRPSNFKSGHGCPKCAGLCPEQAKEEFEQLVTARGHLLKSPYISALKKVNLTCNNGHHFLMRPRDFKKGAGCPICATNHEIKSLYILKDKNNHEIAKIGVSLHPWRRCNEIQQSADKVFKGKHDFEVYTQWDLSFEMHRAVDTETFILQKYSNKKFYGTEKLFDGSSEILLVPPEELEKEVIDFWK